MNKIPGIESIDLSPYAPDLNDLPAMYGLPESVQFCRKCVISNQRPNTANEFAYTKETKKSTLGYNEEGICDPCTLADYKENKIDWEAREQELLELCDRYRRNDGRYDCLVPASGGKDSIFAAHILKYKYGMNPLTVTWAPHMYTPWGWKNLQAMIHAGFDNHLFTPNGKVHRLLTRLAMDRLFHPFQSFIMGQKAYAPKLAAKLGISLIFYGENPAEHGNKLEENESPLADWSKFTASDPTGIHIAGFSLDELTGEFGINAADLSPYIPANPDTLHDADIDVRHLGYYLKWHIQGNYYYAVDNAGFIPSPERSPGTYSKYNSIDDKLDDFHFYTCYIKFGLGRASYEGALEMRNGDITREDGIALVRRFDGEFPERFADEVFQYLSIPESEFPVAHGMFEEPTMTREYFDNLCDRHRSPHLWKHEDGEWRLRHTVWQTG